MKFVLVNQSPRVGADAIGRMALATQIQLGAHCAPVHGWLPDTVEAVAESKDVPADADVVFVVRDKASDPDALGWHTELPSGAYVGEIAADPVLDNGGGGVLDGGVSGYSVSSVVSHEAVETRGDLSCNLWVDGPLIKEGSEYAYELCDPVEGDSYVIVLPDGSGVLVSNWCGPRYFDPQAPAGAFLDYCGKATKPFELVKNGYFIVRRGPGTEQEVFGAARPPAWRLETKKRGRTARRKRPRITSTHVV